MTHPDRAIEAGAQQLVTLEFGRHARLENLTVPMQARYRDDIKSILTALAAEGLVVVPKEPSEAMIEAASNFYAYGKWTAADDSIYGGIYAAMIANRPLAAAQNGEDLPAPPMGK